MATAHESNKAKIAKRVIEVLEFFDDEHREATVMDIVRRYDRPQSSTSELLSSLVDLGLLYKDPCSRSYTLTPRAAMLGSVAQPDIVRDGRLTMLVDRLVAQTGLAVAVFGLVGLNVQIFSWRAGSNALRTLEPKGFCGGLQAQSCNSAAGWLLLSTIAQPRRDATIRRLNAEAAPERKFSFPEMAANVQACHDVGHSVGVAGFESSAETCAVLLPGQPDAKPMAIGFVYEPNQQIETSVLIDCLQEAIVRCLETPSIPTAQVQAFSSAA